MRYYLPLLALMGLILAGAHYVRELEHQPTSVPALDAGMYERAQRMAEQRSASPAVRAVPSEPVEVGAADASPCAAG